MDISKIGIGEAPPHDVNILIEIPQGGVPVKYELDKASGALRVDRFLHTAMFYPGNYGFIPHTLSGDGDPVDVIVVGPGPVVPGAIIRCRPVGAMLMKGRGRARTRRSSPCPWTSSIRFTAACARTKTCRKRYASRSCTSSGITRSGKG
jgi:inorganic pyrophosphatase